eukprot:4769616-Heterocapsa_arctica.AAC.1
MSVVGRAWYEQSLMKGPEVKYGYFEHGGLSHRCRESAILVQQVASWHLRRMKKTFATTFFDTANAFPSTDRDALREATSKMAPSADLDLHEHRLCHASLVVK